MHRLQVPTGADGGKSSIRGYLFSVHLDSTLFVDTQSSLFSSWNVKVLALVSMCIYKNEMEHFVGFQELVSSCMNQLPVDTALFFLRCAL